MGAKVTTKRKTMGRKMNELNITRSLLNSIINAYHLNSGIKTNDIIDVSIFTHQFHKIVFNTLKTFENANYCIDQMSIEYKLFEIDKTNEEYKSEWLAIISSSVGGKEFVNTYVKMLQSMNKSKLAQLI